MGLYIVQCMFFLASGLPLRIAGENALIDSRLCIRSRNPQGFVPAVSCFPHSTDRMYRLRPRLGTLLPLCHCRSRLLLLCTGLGLQQRPLGPFFTLCGRFALVG